MDLTQALLLGILQGFTEFLPISSSGHLILVPWILGWQEHGLAFDVALHLGTLVAVLVYFRSDWLKLIAGFGESLWQRRLVSYEARLSWFILFGTVPGALAGALGESYVEEFFHSGGNPGSPSELQGVTLVALTTILMGILLYLVDRRNQRARGMEKLGLSDALLVGLAQAAAIIPGVSRSGATITMGLFRGLNRETAARFSFLLGTPVIAGAGAKQVYDILQTGLPPGEAIYFAAGVLAAAAVGYVAIAFMLRYLARNSTLIFFLYRLALGVGILALVLARS